MNEPVTSARKLLTYDECVAWAKKYNQTPWLDLPLRTTAEGDASPLLVMRSLFVLLAKAKAGRPLP